MANNCSKTVHAHLKKKICVFKIMLNFFKKNILHSIASWLKLIWNKNNENNCKI